MLEIASGDSCSKISFCKVSDKPKTTSGFKSADLWLNNFIWISSGRVLTKSAKSAGWYLSKKSWTKVKLFSLIFKINELVSYSVKTCPVFYLEELMASWGMKVSHIGSSTTYN